MCCPKLAWAIFLWVEDDHSKALVPFALSMHPANVVLQPSVMNIFELNDATVSSYVDFSRSFAHIRAADLREAVEAAYRSNIDVHEQLISLNPHFARGSSVGHLSRDGTLHPDAARVVCAPDGTPFHLHRHQDQAISLAKSGQSYVVTTGTGSGKSLCFFIPLIDAALRARQVGEAPRTRAIVIYPMNALANSQLEEITGFLWRSDLSDPPRVARYTGQESASDRPP